MIDRMREAASKEIKLSAADLSAPMELGRFWNNSWARDPKSVLFMLARYKFASKLIRNTDDVLEVGCGEGLGSAMLSSEAATYLGIDHDPDMYESARRLQNKRRSFLNHDILHSPIMGRHFTAAVSLDVIEHVFPAHQDNFLKNIVASLSGTGSLLVIGSPSLESQVHASAVSKAGHVGCRSARDLEDLIKKYSARTFAFSMNDEVVHTGFAKMSHYNFVVGVI